MIFAVHSVFSEIFRAVLSDVFKIIPDPYKKKLRLLFCLLGLKSAHLNPMLILFIRSIFLYILVFAVIRLTGKRQLSDLQPFDLITTLLIADLASMPGGTNPQTAEQKNINYVFLPGIPGKYSPASAADIILKTIENIIAESGKDAKLWIYGKKE